MLDVGGDRGVRTISIALVAGLVAFEAVLALSAGTVGIPGVLVLRVRDAGIAATAPNAALPEGGESSIAKLPTAELPKPSPLARAAKLLPPDPPVAGEAKLDGLAEIPLDALARPKAKADESKPPEPQPVVASVGGKEVLPWDAVEPYRLSADDLQDPAAANATASVPAAPAPKPAATPAVLKPLPASRAVEGWVKAKATEIKGEDRARALYHFEFWLDAPAEVKQRVVAVAYEFNTPAVMPQSQVSSDGKTSFRISAGGLTCADQVTVTLRFDDGQSEQVVVDGCRLVDSA